MGERDAQSYIACKYWKRKRGIREYCHRICARLVKICNEVKRHLSNLELN